MSDVTERRAGGLTWRQGSGFPHLLFGKSPQRSSCSELVGLLTSLLSATDLGGGGGQHKIHVPRISEVLLSPHLFKKKKRGCRRAFKYEVTEIHPHQSYIRARKPLKAVMTMLIHRMHFKGYVFIQLIRAVAKPVQAIVFPCVLTMNYLLYG